MHGHVVVFTSSFVEALFFSLLEFFPGLTGAFFKASSIFPIIKKPAQESLLVHQKECAHNHQVHRLNLLPFL